jgi:hypothetical protein
VPPALQATIAFDVQDEVDADASGDDCTHQWRTVAGEVFGQASVDVAVERHADIVTGVPKRSLEVQKVHAGAHAEASASAAACA